MAQGRNTIYNLNEQEYKAAMAAIKLVRGDEIKNAFFEGYSDGFKDGGYMYKGARVAGEQVCWEHSHAKALSHPRVD